MNSVVPLTLIPLPEMLPSFIFTIRCRILLAKPFRPHRMELNQVDSTIYVYLHVLASTLSQRWREPPALCI